MYVIEDILIRYHRMRGDKTLWLAGADHAGFETQFVFEKKLQSEGKSRFDFDNDTLYKMIWDFVANNRPVMEAQLRKLGFSLDWTRKKFTLDKDVIEIVYETFEKLYKKGLVYRAKRLVNYCTFDGTSFSDLEVIYEEKKNSLYYMKYGPLVVATTRPETKFGDTAVAVHPDDKRYKKYVGQEIEIETVLGKRKIKVVSDKAVDPEFGTGVVKITPAHDFNDFEIAQRHNLEMVQVINYDGKMNKKAGKFKGMYVRQARKAIVEEMQKKGLMEKIDENYTHRIGVCYKCKNPIEPLPLEQWFVKTKQLSKPAIEAVKKGAIKIVPKSFESHYLQFLENIKDWNISRQIVWGIRIPAWLCKDCNSWTISAKTPPEKCSSCQSTKIEQDKDTFDTWFSSGQWPYATLKTTKPGDFETFYPTSVMETGYDILPWWVARMAMLGLFIDPTKVPFKTILLHGLVKDPLGKKMSKSKGNAVNPIEIIEKYGADAVRFALVYGTALGNDQSLFYPKLQAMRNFTNKLWNMGRFIEMSHDKNIEIKIKNLDEINAEDENDKKIVKETQNLVSRVSTSLEKYGFNEAAQEIYEFTWHVFADKYIEEVKSRINENSFNVLLSCYLTILKLLHPFMPFVTEEIFRTLWGRQDIMVSSWPKLVKS